jgi:hypothetical protein
VKFKSNELVPDKNGSFVSPKNHEGYADLTAYKAVKNTVSDKEYARFHEFLWTLFKIADLAGFRIKGRITVEDVKTGRIWT